MKALVVGNGPSKQDIDFIKNFDGLIMSVEVATPYLLEHGITPDYIGFLEVTGLKHQKFVVDLMPKLAKLQAPHIRNIRIVYRDEEAPILKAGRTKYNVGIQPFQPPAYLGNVGLLCICFLQRNVRPEEVHLIGMEHKGDEYKEWHFLRWLHEFKKYVWTEPDFTDNIIDHSNGRIGEWLSGDRKE